MTLLAVIVVVMSRPEPPIFCKGLTGQHLLLVMVGIVIVMHVTVVGHVPFVRFRLSFVRALTTAGECLVLMNHIMVMVGVLRLHFDH